MPLATVRQRFTTVAATAPRAYWFIWWGSLINRLGTFVIPLLAIYLTRVRHVSDVDATATVSYFGLGMIAASLVGGQLADRLGRRITMLISLFGGAAATLALGEARDLTTIRLLVTLVGFVGELYRPAVAAFVADVIPGPGRLHAYGLLYWAVNLGFAGGLLLGGVLADLDFRLIFLGDAATMALYGALVAVAVPETRPPPAGDAGPPPSSPMLHDRPFLVFAAICLALVLIPLQSVAMLPVHMTAQGLSSTTFGAVVAVNGVLIILFQPALTTWSERFDSTRLLAAAAVIYGLGMAGHGLAATALGHAAAVVVWTLAEILESPTRSAIIAQMAPADQRGRYQGVLALTWGVGQLAAPRLGGAAADAWGPLAPWLGCAVLGVAVAVALLATAPARRRRLAEPERGV
jgi:MFS family permease